MWDEARKLFAASPDRKRHPDVSVVTKDLALADVSLGEFLTSKFTLWLDLRTTDDDRLHGSGHRIENASKGVTIQITKKAEAAGALNIYLYIIMDAQQNLEDGRFVSAVTGHNLGPLGHEPQLSDFYHPSGGQRDRDITFVIPGMAATGFVAYRLAKK